MNFPQDIAFDHHDDLWVTSGSTLTEYTSSQLGMLAANAAPTPATTLTSSTALSFGIAFDAAGDLWAVTSSGAIVEFTAAQLATGGNQTPTIVLTPALPAYVTPSRLTFDGSGDLWFITGGTEYGPGSVPPTYELAKSSLSTSGSPTPVVTLAGPFTLSAGQVANGLFSDIAFDPSGNLWGAFGGEYFEYTSLSNGSAPSLVLDDLYPALQQVPGDPNHFAVPGSPFAIDRAGDLYTGLDTYQAILKTVTPQQYASSSTMGTADGSLQINAIAIGPSVP